MSNDPEAAAMVYSKGKKDIFTLPIKWIKEFMGDEVKKFAYFVEGEKDMYVQEAPWQEW